MKERTSLAAFFAEDGRIDLRKVRFTHWKTKEITNGWFHQWAHEADGEGQSGPVAIIEMADGHVETVYAGHITFVESFNV